MWNLEVPVTRQSDGTYTGDPSKAVLSNGAGTVATGAMALFLGGLALQVYLNGQGKQARR